MSGVPLRRGDNTDTLGERGESHVTTEADAAASQGASGIAGNHQQPGERRGADSRSEPSEGANLADILISDF